MMSLNQLPVARAQIRNRQLCDVKFDNQANASRIVR
jgi:hypothetical protein